MLCGGDSVTDVHTLSHDIHIAVGNTTEISKDSIPHDHVEVKDGEEPVSYTHLTLPTKA